MISCLIFILLASQGFATLAMYEAGKAMICIDDRFEKTELEGMFDIYPTMYFEPVTSRDEVKNNEYTFIINKITIVSPGDLAVLQKPVSIMISDNPFNLNNTFSFTPWPVKTVSVGKLGLVNTTLYTGSWSEQTPHLVAFTVGNFSCCIYGQDIKQSEMEDFLKRVDILDKNDIAIFMPLLWTEFQ